MCVPFPFLFYKYGKSIRMKCKYAAQAAKALEDMKAGGDESADGESEEGQEVFNDVEGSAVEDASVAGQKSEEKDLEKARSRE
jgi:hypothetical protein